MQTELVNRLQRHGPQDAGGLSALDTFVLDEMLLAHVDQNIANTLGVPRRAITALRDAPETIFLWEQMQTRSVEEGETLRAKALRRKKARAVTRQREEKALFGTQDAGHFTCKTARKSRSATWLKAGGWLDIAGWLTLLTVAGTLAGLFAAHHHLLPKGIF